MKKRRFRFSADYTIVIPIALLVVLASALLYESDSLISALRWVDHASQVIGDDRELLKLTIDMETGVRRLQYTGNVEFLQPFNEAVQVMDAKYAALDQLISDNPSQMAQLGSIRSSYAQWRILADESIRFAESSRIEPADVRYTKAEQRKKLMDLIRAKHEALISNEDLLRERRVRESEYLIVKMSLLVIPLLGAGGFFLLVRRQRADQKKARRIEEELRLSNEKVRLMVLGIKDYAIFMLDPEGRVATWNESAQQINGYTTEEIVGIDFSVLYAPEAIAQGEPSSELDVAKKQGRFESEGPRVRKDGSRLWVSSLITPLEDAQGRLRGFGVVMRNISARKRAEVELAKAGALQTAIFNSANFSSIATDAQGVIQIFNVGAERMLGYDAADVMNKFTPADFSDSHELVARAKALSAEFKGSIAPGFEALVFRAARGIEDIYDLTYIRKDGSRFPAIVSVTALRDINEAIIGYLLIGTDNSARKQAGEALRLSDEKLRLLADGTRDYAILMLDPDGIITTWSKGAEAIEGYRAEEIIGSHFSRFYTAEDNAEDLPARILVIASQQGRFEGQGWRVRKDGTQFWASVVINSLRGEDGRLLGFAKATRDNSEQDALLRTIHLHSIVSVADRAGIIADVNDSFCAISGYSRAELVGRTHSVVNSGVHPPAFWTAFWRDISSGKSWRGEICNRSKDGSLYWVDSIVVPFLGRDGSISKYVSIRTDVTAARVSEGKLREANLRIALATEGGGIGIWELEIPLGKRIWSPKMFEIFGIPDHGSQPSTEDVARSCHPEDRALVKEQYAAMAVGAPFHVEFRCIHPNGEVHWVETSGNRVLGDDSSRPVRFIGVGRDISDRKQAETALREQDAKFRSMVEAVPQMVWITRADGWNIYFSQRWMDYTGLTLEESLGHGWNKPFHPDDQERAWDAWQQAVGTVDGDYRLECRLRRADGVYRWFLILGVRQVDIDGTTQKWFGTCTDISLAKQSEAELLQATEKAERANFAKSEFLANMSHEIRTPMNAILGMTHLALRAHPNPQQLGYLTKIGTASESLLGIINDILDFSKIEAGMLELERVPFSLAALLNKIHDILDHRARKKDLSLLTNVAQQVPHLLIGDPLRLEQILINLVNNAIKFSENGTIIVNVTAEAITGDSGRFTFTVRDKGIGMSPETVANVFQSFHQADTSITRKYGGTGLGLAISKRLCDLMGGSISVESELGNGSTFLFTMPLGIADQPISEVVPMESRELPPHLALAETTLEYVEAPGAAKGSLLGRRVLLVEDNEINRDLAMELLSDLGIAVSIAVNGRKGVDRVLANAFDLVLMDIQMPVMDGITATKLIRQDPRFLTLPILAMTAHAMKGDREISLAAGMNDHITKPISPDRLTSALLRWMPPRAVAQHQPR